ncbi:MAG: leucine-rich repeat domain-containing protein [Lachnospiraceae bacterium]|nr:leucine-rich repeat domain-containing protein [Lachnospiraceae bacterium]
MTNLTELEVVNLNGNNIHDISVLARLSKLYYLEIADNPIVDYSPLDDLSEEAEVIRD